MNYPSLSAVLDSRPKILAFDDLVASTPLVAEIKGILLDIVWYLDLVLMTLTLVEYHENDLLWYLEGRDGILDIHRTCDNIDTVISQLLNVMDSLDNYTETDLLGEFEAVSDLTLEVKKVVLFFKRNLDIAMSFNDNEMTISGITDEIEELIKILIKSQELVLQHEPLELPGEFTLLCSLLKIGDTPMTKLRELPFTTKNHKKVYDDFALVEARLVPVLMSLDILPVKIDELNSMCEGLYESMREEHVSNYERLVHRWEFLQQEMKSIKQSFIDVHWRQVYTQLAKVTKHEIVLANLADLPVDDLRQVTNALLVIHVGIADGWLDPDDDLDPEFYKLRNHGDKQLASPTDTRRLSFASPGGLRQFHTGRVVLSLFDVLSGTGMIELKLGKRRSGDRRRLGEKRVSSEPLMAISRLSQEVRRGSDGEVETRPLRSSSFGTRSSHRESVDSITEVDELVLATGSGEKTPSSRAQSISDEMDKKITQAVASQGEQNLAILMGDNNNETKSPEVLSRTTTLEDDKVILDNTIVISDDTMGITDITEEQPTSENATSGESIPCQEVNTTSKPIDEGNNIQLCDTRHNSDNGLTFDQIPSLLSLLDISQEVHLSSLKERVNIDVLFSQLLIARHQLELPYMMLDYFDRGFLVVGLTRSKMLKIPVLKSHRKREPAVAPGLRFNLSSHDRPASPLGYRQDHLHEAHTSWR